MATILFLSFLGSMGKETPSFPTPNMKMEYLKPLNSNPKTYTQLFHTTTFLPIFTTIPFENHTITKKHHMAILLHNSFILQLLRFW